MPLTFSIKSFILTIIFIHFSQATTKTKCDKNCDFKITDIPTTNPEFQLSNDQSYLVSIDSNNDVIRVVDISNNALRASRTLPIGQNQTMTCNQFIGECIIQNASAKLPAPKKLDLSMGYLDLTLQDVMLPQAYAQSPAKIASVSSEYTLLIQNSTNKLVIFDNSDQSILLEGVSPSSDLPISDGQSLLNFVYLDNCMYKFDAVTKKLQVADLFCTLMGFTKNHIVELDTIYNRFNFISKQTFKQLNFWRIDDLTGISPDQKHGYVINQLESAYDIYSIDDLQNGKISKIRSVSDDNDCESMPDKTSYSKTIKAKYGLLKSYNSNSNTETVCFYGFTPQNDNGKDPGSDGFPVWGIVLIVIFGLAIIGGVILGAYCYRKKRRMRREKELLGVYDSMANGMTSS